LVILTEQVSAVAQHIPVNVAFFVDRASGVDHSETDAVGKRKSIYSKQSATLAIVISRYLLIIFKRLALSHSVVI